MVSTRSGQSTTGAFPSTLKIKLRVSKTVESKSRSGNGRSTIASSVGKQKLLSGRISKPGKGAGTRVVGKTEHVVRQTTKVVIQQQVKTVRRRVRHRSKSLKIKLGKINFSCMSKGTHVEDYRVVQQRKRLENFKGRYYPAPLLQYRNQYGFKFDHNPFQHLGFKGPTVSDQWQVYELMKNDLKENFGKDCFLDQPDASTNELQGGPMHMSDDLSVDNLVKVILSISTENSLAIRQHAQLCSAFTYTVDGKEVKGSVPNYHKMRTCTPDELVRALNVAGYQNMRQKAFHAILNEIYHHNVEQMVPGEVIQEGNLAGERDFVPGLLSMDYLKGDGLTKQERFDLLVKFNLIAVKTGCCLLAFNLKIPVFVVDTHVHQMTRNLGWIPEDCYDADKACMFLDTIMPEQLKFGLHQAFWHHRINCARCAPRASPKSLTYQQRICPLEHLIKRDLPSMNRSPVRDSKDSSTTKARKTSLKVESEEKLPGSVAFMRMHYKTAETKGYLLRKVEIDDDFGDGSRQNKNGKASYYWGLKEFTHVNDVVKFDDALDAMGVSTEKYEARFAKKARVMKKKKAAKKAAGNASGGDVEMGDGDSDWDNGFDWFDGDDSDDEDFEMSAEDWYMSD